MSDKKDLFDDEKIDDASLRDLQAIYGEEDDQPADQFSQNQNNEKENCEQDNEKDIEIFKQKYADEKAEILSREKSKKDVIKANKKSKTKVFKYDEENLFANLSKKTNVEKRKMQKIDFIAVAIFVLLASVFAFLAMGDIFVPTTCFESRAESGKSSDFVVVQKTTQVAVKDAWVYVASPKNSYKAVVSVDIANNLATGQQQEYLDVLNAKTFSSFSFDYSESFKWIHLTSSLDELDRKGQYVKVSTASPGVRIAEVVLFDDFGNLIEVNGDPEKSTDPAGKFKPSAFDYNGEGSTYSKMFDEQNSFPSTQNHFASLYMYETYDVSNAVSLLDGDVLKGGLTTPFAVEILAVAISVFGRTTFGMRLLTTLIGILLVFVCYVFAKRLLRSTPFAIVFSTLFLLDTLRLTASRIVSIVPIFSVLVVLALYCLVLFSEKNILKSSERNSAILNFTIGAFMFSLCVVINMWAILLLGVYAIVVIPNLINRAKEYKACVLENEKLDAGEQSNSEMAVEGLTKKQKRQARENQQTIKAKIQTKGMLFSQGIKNFEFATLWIVAISIVMFIILPIAIDMLSYIPTYASGFAYEIRTDFFTYFDHYFGHKAYLINNIFVDVETAQTGVKSVNASLWILWLLGLGGFVLHFPQAGVSTSPIANVVGVTSNLMISICSFVAICYFVFMLISNYIKSKKGKEILKDNIYVGTNRIIKFLIPAFVCLIFPFVLRISNKTLLDFFPVSIIYVLILTVLLKNIYAVFNTFLFDIKIKGKVLISVTSGKLVVGIVLMLALINFIVLLPIYSGITMDYGVAIGFYRLFM